MAKEGKEEDLRKASNLENRVCKQNGKQKMLLLLTVVVLKFHCVPREMDLISGIFPELLNVPGVE